MMRFRGIPSRLSYANVVATLALFIAIGGSSYAAVAINGNQIRARSIPGSKLKAHTVTAHEINAARLIVGRALISDTTRHLAISHRVSVRGRRALDSTSSTSTSPSIVTLAVGQSAPVIQSGPFTYTATCTADSSGQSAITIAATSSEEGTLIDSSWDPTTQRRGLVTTMSAGQPIIESNGPTTDQWDILRNGAQMLAPSGAALLVSLSYGTGLFGSSCWAMGFGIGG